MSTIKIEYEDIVAALDKGIEKISPNKDIYEVYIDNGKSRYSWHLCTFFSHGQAKSYRKQLMGHLLSINTLQSLEETEEQKEKLRSYRRKFRISKKSIRRLKDAKEISILQRKVSDTSVSNDHLPIETSTLVKIFYPRLAEGGEVPKEVYMQDLVNLKSIEKILPPNVKRTKNSTITIQLDRVGRKFKDFKVFCGIWANQDIKYD
jgi:hypothetical protein